MSNEKQETVEDIVAEMRNESHAGDESCLEWVGAKMRTYADRFEAAHQREVDKFNFDLMTIKSEQKTSANVIIEQTNKCEELKREVAELKHWIKSAARWIKCHDIYHTSGDYLIKQAKEILNDDGEFLFKKGEQ